MSWTSAASVLLFFTKRDERWVFQDNGTQKTAANRSIQRTPKTPSPWHLSQLLKSRRCRLAILCLTTLDWPQLRLLLPEGLTDVDTRSRTLNDSESLVWGKTNEKVALCYSECYTCSTWQWSLLKQTVAMQSTQSTHTCKRAAAGATPKSSGRSCLSFHRSLPE